jgi:ABC-type branched-subunit amino acid transport system substrate-binding protein
MKRRELSMKKHVFAVLAFAVLILASGPLRAQGPGGAALFAPEGGAEAGGGQGAPPGYRPPLDPEARRELDAAEGETPALLFTAPLDGVYSSFGRSAVLGAELAHRIWGRSPKYDLIVENESQEGPLYNRVPRFARVKAAAGHLFGSSLAENAPYYGRYNIPVLAAFPDSRGAEPPGGAVYRLTPDVPAQARLLAERTLKSAGKLRNVVVLETPAAPFRLLADSYEAFLRDPNDPKDGSKRRRPPLPKRVKVTRVVLDDMKRLEEAVSSIRMTPQDIVVLALSSRQAVEAAPYFRGSNFQNAAFLGGFSLSTRDVCSAYAVAVKGLNLEAAVPLDLRDSKSDLLNEFVHRFRLLNRQDPSWPAVTAYDAVSLAIQGTSSMEGPLFFTEGGGPKGIAGVYNFQEGKVPGALVKVTADSVVYFP